MSFVIDASVALCWGLREEINEVASHALRLLRDGSSFAPALWWFEVRNVLVQNERKKRISEDQSGEFLLFLGALPIKIDRDPVERQVMGLARRHGLTVYDAAYLELAMRRKCALATLDGALERAARAEGVALIGDDPTPAR